MLCDDFAKWIFLNWRVLVVTSHLIIIGWVFQTYRKNTVWNESIRYANSSISFCPGACQPCVWQHPHCTKWKTESQDADSTGDLDVDGHCQGFIQSTGISSCFLYFASRDRPSPSLGLIPNCLHDMIWEGPGWPQIVSLCIFTTIDLVFEVRSFFSRISFLNSDTLQEWSRVHSVRD